MRRMIFYLLPFLITFGIGSAAAFKFWTTEKTDESLSKSQTETANVFIEPQTTPTPQKLFDQNGEEIVWQGESGGFKIRWTDKDIYVEKNNKTEKLFTNFAKKYYNLKFKYDFDYSEKSKKYVKTKRLTTCDISIDGQIASLVGKYLTLEIEEYYMCGAIQYHKHWVVIDLEHPNRIRFSSDKNDFFVPQGKKLTDIFADKNILRAFLSNAEVGEMIRIFENNNHYKSTYDLLYWFQKTTNSANSDYKSPPTSSDFEFKHLRGGLNSLNTNAMTKFAFNRIEKGKIVVQSGLEPAGKDHEMYYLELFLDIPDSLKKDVEVANSRESGFLGKDAEEMLAEHWTSLYFEAGKK